MWKTVIVLGYFVGVITATPVGVKNMQIMREDEEMQSSERTETEKALATLNLPSNATSIRADITDGFSCENLTYGYYADVDNDCQVFHVCLPVVYPDGKENTFRWSFICPEETVFSQDSFTCMRSEDMSFGCEESVKYYELNRNFGMVESSMEISSNEMEMNSNQMLKSTVQDLDDDISLNDADQEIKQSNQKPEIMEKEEMLQEMLQPSKLDNNKNRRKNTNRKPVQNKQKPIRKISTTIKTTPLPSTTLKLVEQEIITEKPLEKTTVKYHQRFTKRPDYKDNKKRPESPTKFETQPHLQQKRKRPQVTLNSNIKRIDVIGVQSPKEPENPKLQIEKGITENLVPAGIIKDPVEIIPSEIKPIIIKSKEEEPLNSVIVNIKKPNEILSVIKKQSIDTEPSLSSDIVSLKSEDDNKLIIPEEEEKEQQQQQQQQVDAESNRIAMIPAQFIKVDEESMNHNDKTVEKPNQEHDQQQSMIINLISSLINAENSKAEEEKIDNITNVQYTEEINHQKNENIIVPPEMQELNMSEVITSKIPEMHIANDGNQILNSDHVVDNVEEKNAENYDDNKWGSEKKEESSNNEDHQSQFFNHMTHIPVKILTSNDDVIDRLPIDMTMVKEAEKLDTKQKEIPEKEIMFDDRGEEIVEKLQNVLLKLKSQAESLDAKISPENENVQDSSEVIPIFHRIPEVPSNYLKSDLLSVSSPNEPIVLETKDLVKKGNDEIVTQPEDDKKLVEEHLTVSQVSPVLIESNLKIEENKESELNKLNKLQLENKLVTTNVPVVKEEQPALLNLEKADNLDTVKTSNEKSSFLDQSMSKIRSAMAARSLNKRMDPRKRRFLFRSDIR